MGTVNEYTIICPNCDGEMDDTNRLASTMKARCGAPGAYYYQYVYRCPSCGAQITWTEKTYRVDVKIEKQPRSSDEWEKGAADRFETYTDYS